jgi:hypothetical protein
LTLIGTEPLAQVAEQRGTPCTAPAEQDRNAGGRGLDESSGPAYQGRSSNAHDYTCPPRRRMGSLR